MSKMTSSPLVSIVVTVYNKEAYIAETLDSVRNQIFSDFEVIIVNDGSTDQSAKVIKKICESDKRFNLIQQTNAGVSAARNRGFSLANGELIQFLDGDDLLLPEFLLRTVELLDKNPKTDIVHTSWERINVRGEKIGEQRAPNPSDYLKEILLGNLFAPSAMLFRRSILEKAGPFLDGMTTAEDWEHIARCAKSGAKFLEISAFLARYREVPSSRRKISENQKMRFFVEIEEIFSEDLAVSYRNLKDLSLVRHHFFLMEDYLKWTRLTDAQKHFEAGIKGMKNLKNLTPWDHRYLSGFFEVLPTKWKSAFLFSFNTAFGCDQAALLTLRYFYHRVPFLRTLVGALK